MATGDLTTLAAVKTWLPDMAQSTASDALLAGLITAASGFVADYLERDLLLADRVETRLGTGGQIMVLRHYPIVSVLDVTFEGRTVNQPADPAGGRGGFLFEGQTLALIGDAFPNRSPVTVRYTAGYAAPPVAVAQAVVELVGEAFRRRDRIGQVSKSLSGGVGEVVAFSQRDMNAAAAAMLAPYRRLAG